MKGSTLRYLLVVVFASISTATIRADSVTPGEVPPENQKHLDQEVSGIISAIDISARIVIVRGAFANKTFKVSPDAQIIISRVPGARLDDLKVGDQVDISYHEQDGAFVATHITRVEAPPPVEK